MNRFIVLSGRKLICLGKLSWSGVELEADVSASYLEKTMKLEIQESWIKHKLLERMVSCR